MKFLRFMGLIPDMCNVCVRICKVALDGQKQWADSLRLSGECCRESCLKNCLLSASCFPLFCFFFYSILHRHFCSVWLLLNFLYDNVFLAP